MQWNCERRLYSTGLEVNYGIINLQRETGSNGGCVNPVTSTGLISVDIGVNANLELVDKFCYLGDMLRVDGDVKAAVETRI